MSFQAMADVIKLDLESSEKFVLLMLANYCDHEGGSCFPSVARLAKDTSLSESTVKRALRSLRDYSGIIAVTTGGGTTANRYKLDLDLIEKLGQKYAVSTTPEVTLTPPTPVMVTPHPGHIDPPHPGHGDPPPRSHRPPSPVMVTYDPINEPTKEPIKKPPPSTRTREVRLDAPTEAHKDLAKQEGIDCEREWAKYIDWLKATGKRPKDMGAQFSNWIRRAGDDRKAKGSRPAGAKAAWQSKQEQRDTLMDAIFNPPRRGAPAGPALADRSAIESSAETLDE